MRVQLGPAFPIPQNMLHSSDEFEEGWLVCEAQLYKREQLSPRGYRYARLEFACQSSHWVHVHVQRR